MSKTSSRWTDEQLMAWADGLLANDDVSRLEADIETDGALAARAAAMQQTRVLVQEAWDVRAAAEPVPAALRQAVVTMVARDRERRAADLAAAAPIASPAAAGAAPPMPAAPARHAGTPAGWRARIETWLRGFTLPMALAASLVGGVLGFLIGQARPEAPSLASEASEASLPTVIAQRAEPAPGPASAPASVPPPQAGPTASPAPAPAQAAPPAVAMARSARPASEARRAAGAAAADSAADSAAERALEPATDRLARRERAAREPAEPYAEALAPGLPAGLAAVGSAASRELARLLDQLPSGEEDRIAGAALAMVATYRDARERLCRDFSVALADATRVESVACRDGNAAWQVTYASLVDDRQAGFEAASSDSALQTYLGSIGAGQPLDPEAERRALQPRRE